LCLPTAPGLPLRRTETSVHRPIFEQLSDKPLLAVTGYVGCRKLKNNGGSRIYALMSVTVRETRDGPSQVQASNRCKLLSSKAMVVSIAVNVETR
jgi:hypothetical protein